MSNLSQAMRGHLAMLLFSASVAGSFSLGSIVANEIEPAAINAVRYLIATVLMGTVAHFIGKGVRRAHLVAPWRWLLLGAIFALYFVLMFEGLKTAPPVATSAVFTLTPLMTAGFGYLLLRQLMTRRMAFALSVGAGGALWVIFRADLGALLAFEVGRGEAIYFVGCLAHAAFTPLLKRLNRGEPVMASTTLVMGGCFLALAVYGWPVILATDWTGLSPVVWITIGYLAVAASALTTFMLQYAAMRLPSAKVMAYTYLTPSWVILWELALGSGLPSPLLLPGVGLTVVALVVLLKDEEPAPALTPRSGG